MKILVDVAVPAISEHFDVQIPVFMTVGEITPLIAKAVEEMSNHMYISSGTEFLVHAERNVLLLQDESLERYGIRNGDHLLFI